jgi:hypothetical protein
MFYTYMKDMMDKHLNFNNVQHINDTFIKPYSSLQINISSVSQKEFAKIYTSMELGNRSTIPAEEIFKTLHVDLMANLSDTIARFIYSHEYKQLEKAKIVTAKMVKENF